MRHSFTRMNYCGRVVYVYRYLQLNRVLCICYMWEMLVKTAWWQCAVQL